MLTTDINLFYDNRQNKRYDMNIFINGLLLKFNGFDTVVLLHSPILQRELGRCYKSVLNTLGIKRCTEYIVGKKSFGYMLTKPPVWVSTKEERTAASKSTYITFSQGVESELKKLSSTKALHNRAWMLRAMACKSLDDLRISVDSERGNRETNILCLLSKEIRPYVLINGKSTKEIDIKNSQPRFTLQLLDIDGNTFEEKKYKEFVNAIYQGTVYKYVAEKTGLELKQVKKNYNAAWNDDLKRRGSREKIVICNFFKNELPLIAARAKEFAAKNGSKMIGNKAMSHEAKVINTTVADLNKNGEATVAIYDSILTTTDEDTLIHTLSVALKNVWTWAKNLQNETLTKMSTIKDKWNTFKRTHTEGDKKTITTTTTHAHQPPIHVSNSGGVVNETSRPVKHLSIIEQRLSGPDAEMWRRVYNKGEFAKPNTARNMNRT